MRAASVAPRRPSARAIVLDAGRHALPLVALYVRHGSIPIYLVLTAFDLALGLVLIVGTTRDRSDPTTVDPRATILAARLTAVVILAAFLGGVALVLTIPIAMPALLFGWATGIEWRALATDPGFVAPIAAMALVAGARAQHAFEVATTPGERGTAPQALPTVGDLEGDRRRSRIAYAAQVTLVGTYVALSYALTSFGRFGYQAFPVAFAALLTFYDARPEIAARIFPSLGREEAERS